jgi:O-antigen/teichoic acid export membrane protein
MVVSGSQAMPSDISRVPNIVSHSVVLLFAQLGSAAIALVTTPYIALGLGAERYGVYILAFVLLGYFSLLDFGLSHALVKRISEVDAPNSAAVIEELIDTAATLYGAITIPVVLVVTWVHRPILYFAGVPDAALPVIESAFLVLLLSIPFAIAITVLNAALRGIARFDFVTLFSLTTNGLFSIGAAVLVATGASLTTLFGFYVVLTAGNAIAHWVVVRRLLPAVRLFPRVRLSRLASLLTFSRYMAANQLGATLLQSLDKLLVARLISIQMVGYYAIPVFLSQRLNSLGAAVAIVGFPVASASFARGEVDAFRVRYLQSARALAFMTLAPALAVVILAERILTFWMSPEFAAHGAVALRLLAVGMFAISVATVDAVSIEGAGRPGVSTSFVLIAGTANIAGIALLAPTFGVTGVALSVAASYIGLACLDIWYCTRHVLGMGVGAWARHVAVPSLLTVAICAPIILVAREAVSSLGSLLLVAVFAVAVPLLVGFRLFLSAGERRRAIEHLRASWPGARSAMSAPRPVD